MNKQTGESRSSYDKVLEEKNIIEGKPRNKKEAGITRGGEVGGGGVQ